MMTHARLEPRIRKEQILDAAVAVASTLGFYKMRIAHVAEVAEVSTATVHAYYNTMAQLRRAVMRRAVKDEVHSIIAQGLAQCDPVATKAPKDVRESAVLSLLS